MRTSKFSTHAARAVLADAELFEHFEPGIMSLNSSEPASHAKVIHHNNQVAALSKWQRSHYHPSSNRTRARSPPHFHDHKRSPQGLQRARLYLRPAAPQRPHCHSDRKSSSRCFRPQADPRRSALHFQENLMGPAWVSKHVPRHSIFVQALALPMKRFHRFAAPCQDSFVSHLCRWGSFHYRCGLNGQLH